MGGSIGRVGQKESTAKTFCSLDGGGDRRLAGQVRARARGVPRVGQGVGQSIMWVSGVSRMVRG